jgi:RimJ/RimL family protein N-acetyltransferase
VAHDTSWERLRLYTDRLCLRAPAPRDAEALYDLFADAEVMQGLGKEPVSVVEDVRAMIEEGMIGGWRTDGLGPFILVTTGIDRQVVGQAGLMVFDTRNWTALDLGDRGKSCSARAWLGLATRPLGKRICDRGSRRHPEVGI